MSEKKQKNIFTFSINVGKFKDFLETVSSKGYIADSSSKSQLINDCILRFDNDIMWTIVEDIKRNLICQVKTKVNNIQNPQSIPLEIEEMLKWLETFSSTSDIRFIYENGVIGLKCVRVIKSEINLDTKVVFLTKRLDKIQYDLLTNLSYGTDDDKKLKDKIINNNNAIYTKNKDGIAQLFFGVDCNGHFSVPTDTIKRILDDGKRIGNRVYPFEFKDKTVKVTVKGIDHKKNSITREIRPSNYISEPIENEKLEFSARLTHAINKKFKTIDCYIASGGPMLIETSNDNIDVAYIVTTF